MEAERGIVMGTRNYACGVRNPEHPSQFCLLGGLGWVTPKSQLIAQVSPSQASLRAPTMVYRNVCTVPGPREAFNKCLLAKQKLHRAIQNTGGKIRIKL